MWAEIGRRVMDPSTSLYRDLIAELHVNQIPLDPRSIDDFI
jgi:hypothetical protein